jgi:hypothetical protein
LASPNMQQTRKIKIKMWTAWWILWALTYQIHVVAGKHQAVISSSMNNYGTNDRVMLSTTKLNSSDSQVSRVGIFLLPLHERVTLALFKNVMLLSTPNVLCTLWWGLVQNDTSFMSGPPWTQSSSSSSTNHLLPSSALL